MCSGASGNMKQARIDWSMLFGGVQAACALVITIIAVWGVFFTDLPEVLIRQLRSDVATAQEELIDVRQQQRAAEDRYQVSSRQLEVMEKQLSASEAELREGRAGVEKLQAQRAALESELRTVQEARAVYFRQTYGAVVATLFSSLRSELEKARFEAAKAQQYAAYAKWIVEGERLASLLAEEDQAAKDTEVPCERAQDSRWQAWTQELPSAWSYVYQGFTTNIASRFNLHFSGSSTTRPEAQYRAEDLAYARRELAGFLPQSDGRKSPHNTARAVVQQTLDGTPVELLLPIDREQLKRKITEFLAEEATSVDRPVRVRVPEGASAKVVAHEGAAVLSHVDDFELFLHRLEQQLMQGYDHRID